VLWSILLACRDHPAPRPTDEADADVDADADTDPGTTPTALPPGCGDRACADGETCGVCPVDCGPCAPACDADGACEGRLGETCPACPADCATRAVACGNGECQPGEDAVSCMVDCGPPVWPADWVTAEGALRDAINAHRAAGDDCPSGPRDPAPPLVDDPALRASARAHAWDQALSDYFDPVSCDGRTLEDRAPGARGEALGWGWPTGSAAAAAWMRLPDCDAVMDPAARFVGVGYADVGGDPLWVATVR
jgi:hypothetical protein